mgnify:CR=1 FL=1
MKKLLQTKSKKSGITLEGLIVLGVAVVLIALALKYFI